MSQEPTWQIYQRCVSAFMQQRYDDLDFTVQPNRFIEGLSGVKRQIDVLITGRFEGKINKRIIIDAKKYSRKVDINKVESFIGMMQDCQATNGVLVATLGFTEGAKKRASEIVELQILTYEEALAYQWIYLPCKMKICKKGMILWGTMVGITVAGIVRVYQTGICDTCHSFHSWCWSCGERFAIPDEQSVTCDCKDHWYSAIEANENLEDVNNWLLYLDDDVSFPLIINRKILK